MIGWFRKCDSEYRFYVTQGIPRGVMLIIQNQDI